MIHLKARNYSTVTNVASSFVQSRASKPTSGGMKTGMLIAKFVNRLSNQKGKEIITTYLSTLQMKSTIVNTVAKGLVQLISYKSMSNTTMSEKNSNVNIVKRCSIGGRPWKVTRGCTEARSLIHAHSVHRPSQQAVVFVSI